MSDAALSAVALVVVFAVLGALIFFLTKSEKDATAELKKKEEEEEEIVPAGNSRASRRAAERMKAGARRRKNAGAEEPEQVGGGAEVEEEGEEEDEEDKAPKTHQERLAARKAAKAEVKAEQRAEREAKIQAEKEGKKVSKYEERQRLKELEREEKERAEEEEAERLRQEKEKKEAEEFDKWKDMFSVEGGGSQEDELSAEKQGLLGDFVDFIISRKTVVLEDLAAEFGLRTQEVIDRIQNLESLGRLTGVMDDRGKYIYVSQDEMEKVASYIKERGRISIAELAQKSNNLVDLSRPAAIELSAEDLAAMDADAADTEQTAGTQ
mmetsp:Transcript_23902/g.28924  ORF Transcript_23902/g.28924 Transcript_23902/m.28924 type:complete len:324 (-) Transcript_23902:272-1243(-)